MTPAPDPSKIPKSQRRSTEVAATEYVNLLSDKVEAGFDRLATAQEKTELALAQLTAQVKELAKQQQETAKSIEGHLRLAEKQASNIESQSAAIAELTKLATVLVNRAS